MFAVELALLTGNYVATVYNDRQACEWPPHPARVFSALVATHYAGLESDPVERSALTWLQEQGPPEITASNLEPGANAGREVVTVFVPVNDTTVLGNFEAAQAEVDRLRAAAGEVRQSVVDLSRSDVDRKALAKADKALVKAKKAYENKARKLDERLRKSALGGTTTNATDRERASRLFPEDRVRQPRAFPSIAPDDPMVVFAWPDAKPSDSVRAALKGLCGRVTHVGHSSSLVRLRLVDDPPAPTLVPEDLAALGIRVPLDDQLVRLEEAFGHHQETDPRVLPSMIQGYRRTRDSDEAESPSSFFERDWLLFRVGCRGSRGILPLQRTADIASNVRAALMEHCDGEIPEVLSGHAPAGGPSECPHLMILALPFVGSDHSDGRVLGVGLALPEAVSDEDRRTVYGAVYRWECAIRSQTKTEDDAPELPLGMTGARRWGIQRLEEEPRVRNLRSDTWCRAARVWVTATPIALDRNPGDLRSRNLRKSKAAFAQAESLVSHACERIGLPLPSRVYVTRSALLVGSQKAARFPRFPKNEHKPQRVLVHSRIEFERPIAGPVVLGAGRYYGLGLCRPVRADACPEPATVRSC